MVSSSKKKRGQQRKAAKQQITASTSAVSPENQLVVYTPNGTYIHPNHHKLTAIRFRLGNNAVTDILLKLTSDDVPTQGISWPNISLDQSGIVSSALNFLKRCEDETFEALINVGGDLESPSLWIKVLSKAVELEPSCMLQIAKNIGPLVRCFINDTTRLFFKSNKHWREGIAPFVHLIYDIIFSSTVWEVPIALLKYKGLFSSIILWNFWDLEHRPDIVKVLNEEKCTDIAALGRAVVGKLVTSAADNPSTEDRQILGNIGSMLIVSNNDIIMSYTAELIRFIKDGSKEGVKWNDQTDVLNILQSLMEAGDCIDKDVIMGVIDLGTNHVHDYDGAVVVAGLSSVMLRKGTDNKSCDTRIAFAIRHGLVEICLGFIEQYQSHMPCEEDTTRSIQCQCLNCIISLFHRIRNILKSVHDIALHQKTAKAVRSKKSSIEEKLALLEQNTDITNNPNCKELLDILGSILNINGSYCCRCNRSLSRTEVMQCNGCGHMSYCSRACQKEDWMNGHKLTCSKPCTDENNGQFQGRLWPKSITDCERAGKKLEEFEMNMTMIQLKLFLDHSERILSQAKALGIPLYDCIVVFDHRNCPLTVDTFEYTHKGSFFSSCNRISCNCNKGYFESVEEREGFEASRSKENITCIYISKTYFGDNVLDQDGEVVQSLQMQRLFPHEWLKKGGPSSARGAVAKPSAFEKEKTQPTFRMADLYVAGMYDTSKVNPDDRFILEDLDVSGFKFEHIAAADSAEEE